MRSNGLKLAKHKWLSTVSQGKKKEKSLNWPRKFSLSTSILAQSLCLAGTIWLDPLTVTCVCIMCGGHTLCSGSCMLQGGSGGGRGWGESSRAQDDSTLWVEALVLQAALQHSVIVVLRVQPDWGQTQRNQKGDEGGGKWKLMHSRFGLARVITHWEYKVENKEEGETLCAVRIL